MYIIIKTGFAFNLGKSLTVVVHLFTVIKIFLSR